MSNENEKTNVVSDVSVKTVRKFNFHETIYKSEILRLEISHFYDDSMDTYPSNIDNIYFHLTDYLIELDRDELTLYIMSMLNHPLKRIRYETIDFVKRFNKLLVEIYYI